MNRLHASMYRRITALTDKEIVDLCEEMFHPESAFDVVRGNDEVRVTITTRWGEDAELMKDVVTLTETEYIVDWSIEPEDLWKYRQYLFALGVNPLTRDNPYLKQA